MDDNAIQPPHPNPLYTRRTAVKISQQHPLHDDTSLEAKTFFF